MSSPVACSVRDKKFNKVVSCWYTNADTLTNKMTELKARICHAENIPDIIMVNEVKPKNSRYKPTEAELKINGYDITHTNVVNDEGRGNIIYTKDYLKAREVKFKTNYQESVWVEILLNKGDKLLIGCIYRSPQSAPTNNNILLKLLKEVSAYDATHLLITGDFNYPRVNWSNWTASGDESSEEFLFVETLRDIYMYQHVMEPTRARGSDNPTLLDLVLSNEDGMVDNLHHASPLGRSDHSVLEFVFNAYVERVATRRKIFLYDKGDYDHMRAELTQEWRNHIMSSSGVEAKWTHLK